MLSWLETDLALTEQDWLIAYWHHPPYSDGSHKSDTELEMIEMRQNALPILESYGVDLVLAGHSHSYERSMLLDQHYGSSDTFGPQHILDPSTGRSDDQGPYSKQFGLPAHEGTVYTVAGTAGEVNPASLNHPAMIVTWQVLGSLVLEVEGNRLDLSFLDNMGNTLDYFTMLKGDPCDGADPDNDKDGSCDSYDNCPSDYNPGQQDSDSDGDGDACDDCPFDAANDTDMDGICAGLDNCHESANPDQEDSDLDGIGDVCDPCPADPDNDSDGDGFCADADNCPEIGNLGQADADLDGIGDVCDSCPADADNDVDQDGLCGNLDNCPLDSNQLQSDVDTTDREISAISVRLTHSTMQISTASAPTPTTARCWQTTRTTVTRTG